MNLQAKRSVFRSRKSQRVSTAHASDTTSAFLAARMRTRRIKLLLKVLNQMRRSGRA